jgi:hypothetical protein
MTPGPKRTLLQPPNSRRLLAHGWWSNWRGARWAGISDGRRLGCHWGALRGLPGGRWHGRPATPEPGRVGAT